MPGNPPNCNGGPRVPARCNVARWRHGPGRGPAGCPDVSRQDTSTRDAQYGGHQTGQSHISGPAEPAASAGACVYVYGRGGASRRPLQDARDSSRAPPCGPPLHQRVILELMPPAQTIRGVAPLVRPTPECVHARRHRSRPRRISPPGTGAARGPDLRSVPGCFRWGVLAAHTHVSRCGRPGFSAAAILAVPKISDNSRVVWGPHSPYPRRLWCIRRRRTPAVWVPRPWKIQRWMVSWPTGLPYT